MGILKGARNFSEKVLLPCREATSARVINQDDSVPVPGPVQISWYLSKKTNQIHNGHLSVAWIIWQWK